MKSTKISHLYLILVAPLLLALAVVSCGDDERRAEVDALNAASYANHYRNLAETSRLAHKALSLSEGAGYADGRAEALNNLAFVDLARMRYTTAARLLDSIEGITDNHIELLVASVQRMRLCQRMSLNKEFYRYVQRAEQSMRRLDDDASLLSARQRARLTYARSEYAIVFSTYLYYLGQTEKSRRLLLSIDPDGPIVKDTAQTLAYLYNVGAGGIVSATSHQDEIGQEFDYLMRCYMLSRQYRYTYWEANSLQALSEHLWRPADRRLLLDRGRQEIDYLNVDGVADTLLAGNLSERALTLFERYGDVYQTAGSWRTLSEAYRSIHDYPSALVCLQRALAADTAVNAAPDLVASIREQLSIVYSAMDDKRQSDYNRNIYLDLQERTRQDRFLEARADELSTSLAQLDALILGVVVLIALVCVMLVYSVARRRRGPVSHASGNADDMLASWRARQTETHARLKEQIADTDEQCQLARYELDGYRRCAIEQRAKVWLAQSVMPLISRISHETKRLALGADSPGMAQERRAYIADCVKAIEAYNHLLTTWIQMRGGNFRPRIESFAVADLFATLGKSASECRMRGIELHVKPTDAIVKADRTLTLFMINTITENARRYTPRGGDISLEARTADDYVEISVADTGSGMTPEQASQIFRPYESERGHGFGLPSCKLIIEKYRKMGGIFRMCDIGCQSKAGQGTRMFFRLPRGVARAMAIALLAMGAFPPSASAGGKGTHTGSYAKGSAPATYHMACAARYADSVYFCNIRADYNRSLAYADSCISHINAHVATLSGSMPTHSGADANACQPLMRLSGDYPAGAAELGWSRHGVDMDWSIVLDVRNEVAVAALALHRWALYAYNNALYTQLFRERSADASLPSYVRSMQKAEANRGVAIAMLVALLLSVCVVYYMLYYRHQLYYERYKERADELMRGLADASVPDADAAKRAATLLDEMHGLRTAAPNMRRLVNRVEATLDCLHADAALRARLATKAELSADALRQTALDRDRLYVANNISEGCLSSLKHETMSYPSRLANMIAMNSPAADLDELVDYYSSLYSTLVRAALDSTEGVRPLIGVDALTDCLAGVLRRVCGGKKPRLVSTRSTGGYVVASLELPGVSLTGDEASRLFTPSTSNADFLVCCQAVRDIGERTGARASGISAAIAHDGMAIIRIKIKEDIWKNSKLS